MDRKDEIKKELEELSPILSKLKKENPFEVPSNYFQQLPNQIMEQAKLTPVEKSIRKESWLDRIVASFAFMLRPQVALGLLGLVAITWTAIYTLQPDETIAPIAVSQEIEEEADEYILENIEDFDVDDLAQLAFGEEIDYLIDSGDDLEFDDATLDEILEGVEVEDIEEFL